MKKSLVDTHLGDIIIDPQVIAQFAGNTAVECFGIIGLSSVNVKDGLVKLLKLNSADLGRGIFVSLSASHKLIIDFHIIVAYGVSIEAVTKNLISNVKYKVEEFTGLEIEKINVFVEDVKFVD